ncbi:MAG: hypothetical protein ACI89G_002914 [Minisyncoccia bacterium]|jgi:hypothetical protein
MTDHDRTMSVRSDPAVKSCVSQRFFKVALETLRGGTKSLACFKCFDEKLDRGVVVVDDERAVFEMHRRKR